MKPFDQVGRGMTRIPDHLIGRHVFKLFLGSGWPSSSRLHCVYGSVRKTGRLHFSGVRYYETFHGRSVGNFHRTWSAVALAELHGWVLPLKASAPPGVVADFLLDQGLEATSLYRLLMWFHWLHS